MNKKYTLLLFFCCLFVFQKANASHCAGGELLYKWVSDSTYQITFKLYKDCAGTTSAPSSVPMCYISKCSNFNQSVDLQKLLVLPDGAPNGTPVNSGCSGYSSKCDIPAGTLPGYEEWYYVGVVTLPERCTEWQFSVAIKDRNASVNLTGGSNNPFYVQTTLNNVAAQGNSSPTFSVKPVPFVCINNPYTYNNGVIDADGDSLVYEILQPQEGSCGTAGSPIGFSSPVYNTTNNPIPTGNTFVLDPITGQMSFTPTVTGANTLTLRVKEYRNLVLIGSAMRDIQVQIQTCTSVQPSFQPDTLNITGGHRVNGRIEDCANTPLNFCFKVKSPNAGAILVASDNHLAVAPGSIVTYAGQRTDSIQGCFSWIPSAADTGIRNFAVTLKDSTCLPPGIAVSQTFILPIYIHSVTKITKDTTICAGTSFRLQTTGGTIFNWTVLPGGSPLSTLSCINCNNPIASPLVTTRYVVTSNLTSFCNKNSDTVTITVNQLPPLPNLSSNSPVCVGDSLKFNSATSALTYSWTGPAGFHSSLRNPVIANAQTPNSGAYQLIVKNGNCLSPASTLNVTVLRAASLPVVSGDTIICQGTMATFTAGGNGIEFRWIGPNNFIAHTKTINLANSLPEQSGTYYVTAYNSASLSCPSVRDSFQLLITPTVSAAFDISRDHICEGDRITLTSTGDASAIATRNWDIGRGIMESGSGAGPYIARFNEMGAKAITLYVSNKGCKDSLRKFIQVYAMPPSDFTLPAEACVDQPVRVSLGAQVSVDLTPSWDFGSARVLEGDRNNPYYISYATPGYKVVTLTTESTYCRSITTADTILIHANPSARILSTSQNNICGGDLVRFIAAATNEDYNYQWAPVRFFGRSGAEVEGKIGATGYVVLTVSDALGCKSSDSVMITTKSCCQVTMPNAFTPNGDGRNDLFRMVTDGFPLQTGFRIFNRWGQEIFNTSDATQGWNGTWKGKEVDAGTYYYYVRYQCVNEQFYELKGEVILIR